MIRKFYRIGTMALPLKTHILQAAALSTRMRSLSTICTGAGPVFAASGGAFRTRRRQPFEILLDRASVSR